MAKAHIVLVHGAYHQPQHWDAFVKVLNAAGHTTSTPRLPSVSHNPPPDALKADVTAIREAVAEAVAQGAVSIVPVLHSYAGIPGFEALATLTPAEKSKIPRVVCIAAFVIPKDNSLASVQDSEARTYVNIEGPLATVPDPTPYFYSDVDPAVAAEAAALLLPHAVEAFVTTTQHDGCAEFPVTYVVCNKDNALAVDYQYEAVEVCRSREGRKGGRDGVEVVTLESGHSPFLNMPEETAEVVFEAAG